MTAELWGAVVILALLTVATVYAFWPARDNPPVDFDTEDDRAHGRKP